jgi:hypothetical protein
VHRQEVKGKQNLARIVTRTSQKNKTLIGHAGYICQIGAAKCGGVVERRIRINLDVSSQNIKQKKMKIIFKMRIRRKIRLSCKG